MNNSKNLIVYYSYSGNTRKAAEKIKAITGGELFEIKPKIEYPADYNTVVNQVKTEKLQNYTPELLSSGSVENFNIIYIGTPVWWYTMAPPVKSFLNSHNFEDKIIIPFCTHGGGGASNTYSDMKKILQNADVKDGYTSYEDSANVNEINKWISILL